MWSALPRHKCFVCWRWNRNNPLSSSVSAFLSCLFQRRLKPADSRTCRGWGITARTQAPSVLRRRGIDEAYCPWVRVRGDGARPRISQLICCSRMSVVFSCPGREARVWVQTPCSEMPAAQICIQIRARGNTATISRTNSHAKQAALAKDALSHFTENSFESTCTSSPPGREYA